MTITLGPLVHNPIFWNRLDDLRRMQAEQHPLWVTQIQPQIEDVTGKAVYGEMGLGAVIADQIAATQTHAEQVYAIILASENDGLADRNWERGYFLQSALTTRWIWDGITPDQQTTLFNQLQKMVNFGMGVGQPDYGGGFRVTDTDQTVGQYFGIVAAKALFPDLVVPASTGGGGNNIYVFGGLDSTADDKSSVRNSIREMCDKLARGGAWLVSSGYDFGDDVFLLTLGWQAMLDITGVDHFPEIAAFLKQNAIVLIHDLVPTLSDRAHSGDDEITDEGWWDYAIAVSHAACAMERMGETTLAAWLRFRFNEMYTRLGGVYPNRIGPQAVPWLDPYAAAADYRSGLPRTIDCSQGVGQVSRHDGSGPGDSYYWSLAPNNVGVDHQRFHMLTDQIWDGGRWVARLPSGYGDPKMGYALSCPLACGLPNMEVFGSGDVQDADDFLMRVGYSSGRPGATGDYAQPPQFVDEWVRVKLYLPKLKACVTLDRMNFRDPRKFDAATLAEAGKYHPDFIATINGAGALKEVLQYVPNVMPDTATPTGATWKLPDGSPVRYDIFSTGGALSVNVVDCDKKFGNANTWNAINKGSQLVHWGSDRSGFEAIVSVFQWGKDQVMPLPVRDGSIYGAGSFGFLIGSTAVVFSIDGSTPSLIAPKVADLTDYLIGTDAAGKWSVTTQAAAPVVTPGPVVVNPPVVPPAPTVPTLAIGASFTLPDGTWYAVEMVPTLVRKA